MNDLIEETQFVANANAEIATLTSTNLPLNRGYYSLLYTLGSKMVELNNYFLKLYLDEYGRKSVSKSVSAVECFTYNIVKAVKMKQKEISFSSNSNTYAKVVLNGSLITTDVGYDATLNIINLMVGVGLITCTKGYRIENEYGTQSSSGYISLTQDMVNLVEDNVDLHRLRIGNRRSVVVLRDEKRTDLQFTESKYTKEIIKVLDSYNKMMDKHVVVYKDTQLDTGLARIFNNDFNSGGRLYATGGSYQTIPAQTRHMITIDGADTAEVDIKGSHISILHTKVGSRLLRGYDPYDVEMDGVAEYDVEKISFMLCTVDDKHNPFRNLVKVALLIMVNADNQYSASAALKGKVDSQIHKTTEELDKLEIEKLALLRFYGLKNINISLLFKRIKERHSVIKEYLCSGAGVWLQKMEGDIFTKVLSKCIENDYPVLVIHDSVRSKVEHVKKIGVFIEDAWLEVVGDNCNLTLEYEF
jgi:hypothetical protein